MFYLRCSTWATSGQRPRGRWQKSLRTAQVRARKADPSTRCSAKLWQDCQSSGCRLRAKAGCLLHRKITLVQRSVIRKIGFLNVPFVNRGLATLQFLGEVDVVVRRQSQPIEALELAKALF